MTARPSLATLLHPFTTRCNVATLRIRAMSRIATGHVMILLSKTLVRVMKMNNKKVTRREALGVLGAAGAAFAVGCGGSPTNPSSTSTNTTNTTSTNAACAVTPTETAGPFPSLTDLFRSDIRDGKTGTPEPDCQGRQR